MSENDSWSEQKELSFINHLGEHSTYALLMDYPYEYWLQKYIESHQNSIHAHHKAGVRFAGRKLRGIKREGKG